MRVTLKTVKPGIALSASEADSLKGQIGAQVEAMGLGPDTSARIPDFKDSRGNRHAVSYKVLAVNGQDVDIELLSMT